MLPQPRLSWVLDVGRERQDLRRILAQLRHTGKELCEGFPVVPDIVNFGGGNRGRDGHLVITAIGAFHPGMGTQIENAFLVGESRSRQPAAVNRLKDHGRLRDGLAVQRYDPFDLHKLAAA